jgi:hypothetical protein
VKIKKSVLLNIIQCVERIPWVDVLSLAASHPKRKTISNSNRVKENGCCTLSACPYGHVFPPAVCVLSYFQKFNLLLLFLYRNEKKEENQTFFLL